MPFKKVGAYLLFSFVVSLAVSPSAFAGSFQVKLDNALRPLDVVSAFVLPGQALPVEAVSPVDTDKFDFIAPANTTEPVGTRQWLWHAPSAPGIYALEMRHTATDEVVRINAFVMHPYNAMRNGKINGYNIGEYPAGRDGAYAQPAGFVEVTKENENSYVSPHFQVKQFVCKQGGSYPKFVILSERLITKLEMILAAVNAKGYKVPTFHVMSGYRTPAYNRGLGNVKFSRHQYGDAADIYIEDPKTGQMADLNNDGRVDHKDAIVLYTVVQELSQQAPDIFPVGGAGTYESTHAHGPFMHVDARGFNARWGTIAGEGLVAAKSRVRRVRHVVRQHRRAKGRNRRLVASSMSDDSNS